MAGLKDFKNNDFSVAINKRLNGIEIRFVNKMNDDQLTTIKDAGFKWSKRQQLWWAYQDEKSIAFINNLESVYNETPQHIKDSFNKNLNFISNENFENKIYEVTVSQLADLVRQRSELDAKIAQIKEVISENGKKVDVSNQQAKDFVVAMQSLESDMKQSEELAGDNTFENSAVELTVDDLETAKKIIPSEEYATLLDSATHGEEADFFKSKIADIAVKARNLYKNCNGKSYNENTNQHEGYIHYFLGGSDWYISEIDKDNIAFGYAILNNDVENSEYGEIDLNEITTLEADGLLQAELDIYCDDSLTMEQAICKQYPELRSRLLPESEWEHDLKEGAKQNFKKDINPDFKEIDVSSEQAENEESINLKKIIADKINGMELRVADLENNNDWLEIVDNIYAENPSIHGFYETEELVKEHIKNQIEDWVYGAEDGYSQEATYEEEPELEEEPETIELSSERKPTITYSIATTDEYNRNIVQTKIKTAEEAVRNAFELISKGNNVGITVESPDNTTIEGVPEGEGYQWLRPREGVEIVDKDDEKKIIIDKELLDQQPNDEVLNKAYNDLYSAAEKYIPNFAKEQERYLAHQTVQEYEQKNTDTYYTFSWTEVAKKTAELIETGKYNKAEPEQAIDDNDIEHKEEKSYELITADNFDSLGIKIGDIIHDINEDSYWKIEDDNGFVANIHRVYPDGREYDQAGNNGRMAIGGGLKHLLTKGNNEIYELKAEKKIIEQTSYKKITLKKSIDNFGNENYQSEDGTIYVQHLEDSSNSEYKADYRVFQYNDKTKTQHLMFYANTKEEVLSNLKDPVWNIEAVYDDNNSQKIENSKTAKSKNLRNEIKNILANNTDEVISNNKGYLDLLSKYEGGGGVKNEENRTNEEVLNAFYTPRNIVKAVWQIANYYAPNAQTVLEPSSGIGRFAENHDDKIITMREIDPTSARIAKLLHPNANVIQGAFQVQFFDETGRVHNDKIELPKYDLVIGNPPYGEYSGEWKGRGEGKEHSRIEEYFIEKGLDSLKDDKSVLTFVVPSGWLRSGNDKIKELIANKGTLVDAYRLPNKAFDSTDVGTDIIVMKKSDKDYQKVMNDLMTTAGELEEAQNHYAIFNNDMFFSNNPSKVLGIEATRSGRFGSEPCVNLPEGISLDQELSFISGQLAHKFIREQNPNISNEDVEDIVSKKTDEFGSIENFLQNELNSQNINENILHDASSYVSMLLNDRNNNNWENIYIDLAKKNISKQQIADYLINNHIAPNNSIVEKIADVIKTDDKTSAREIKFRYSELIDNINNSIRMLEKYESNIKSGLKNYDVYFSDSSTDCMTTGAKNVAEARKAGNLYIRQWQLSSTISEIRECNATRMNELMNDKYNIIHTAMQSFISDEHKEEHQLYQQLDPMYVQDLNKMKEQVQDELDAAEMNEDYRKSHETQTQENFNDIPKKVNSFTYINADGSINPDLLRAGDIIIGKDNNIPYRADMIFDDNFIRLTSITMKNTKKNNSLFDELNDTPQSDENMKEIGIGWKKTINSDYISPTKEQIESWNFPSWYQKHVDEQNAYEIERDAIRQPLINSSSKGKQLMKEYAATCANEIDWICARQDNEVEDEYVMARPDHEIAEICNFYGADIVKAVINNSVNYFALTGDEKDNYNYLKKEYKEFFNSANAIPINDEIKDIHCSEDKAGHKNGNGNSVWDITRVYVNNVHSHSIKEEFVFDNAIGNKNVQEKNVNVKNISTSNDSDFSSSKHVSSLMSIDDFSRLYGRDFKPEEIPIWKATNWEGIIDRTKLNIDEENLLRTSPDYVEVEPGKFTHKIIFESGDIGAKIADYQDKLTKLNIAKDNTIEDINVSQINLYENNIKQLEKVSPQKIPMERLHFGLASTLAEELEINHKAPNGEIVPLNLQESFILWAQGQTYASACENRRYYRNGIDFTVSNISEEELPNNISWCDIVDYIDKKPVKADRTNTWGKDEDEIKSDKAQHRKEADEKRMARSEAADKLFDRYLHEGLSVELTAKVESEYNRRFNSYIIPDYSKLPLFIDGMSRTKDGKKFKLYDQQIKGISFLCNKGNGLLAYDVGVGKTAAGIVATVNQIQTGRSTRPLIIVPNSVYAKWYKDITDLFPNIKVNDLYNLNKESTSKYRNVENPHKLDIPENSISLVTYEALKNITFTDHSCENELFEDYSKLLSEEFDGTDVENSKSADKIKNAIGESSQVKNANFVFFEDCGFDNITVDEAHNFKNLWTIPRPKTKGESNEFAGIPTGRPSARALKLFGMTQLTQRNHEDRNVFLLTATPFTNSPLEVYSMLSYVGRKRLIKSGLYSLRDFCNEFAHTKLELGVSPKGDVEQKQVMKDWKELKALQNILTEYIDKVDGEELKEIIRPKKFTHVQELEMSDLQKKMMEIDTAKMSEVKEGNSAAVIVSMNAMRLDLVAPALADPARYPVITIPNMKDLVETSPKLKFVCDSVIDMYKHNPDKGQFIYMPLGQTAHGIVKDYLISHGLPKDAIEIISGSINNSTELKDKVTSQFNDLKSKCKILIGGKNTSEGIDLNGNSFVMYNCSLGWNPSETIQAEGRIWRQGNMQGHVHCVYPVMNDSIDALLYQKHYEKRSRINDLWTYKDSDTLNVEDIKPEDLRFELIKDPQKRANMIFDNETKEIQNELLKVESRIKSFDEIFEKKTELKNSLIEADFDINKYEHQAEDYKSRGLDIPEWCKSEIKDNKKCKESYERQLDTITRKLNSWGIKTEEDYNKFIPDMNKKKHQLEKEISDFKNDKMPKIIQQENIKVQEKKILLPSVTEQMKSLTDDIQKNLRPMKEIEPEIRTERFNQMLEKHWQQGEITTKDKVLYSSVGYEKYYEWLDGTVDSLEPFAEESEKKAKIETVVKDAVEKISQLAKNNNTSDVDVSLHYDNIQGLLFDNLEIAPAKEIKVSESVNVINNKIVEKSGASKKWADTHIIFSKPGINRKEIER
jgi:hypothetical protein